MRPASAEARRRGSPMCESQAEELCCARDASFACRCAYAGRGPLGARVARSSELHSSVQPMSSSFPSCHSSGSTAAPAEELLRASAMAGEASSNAAGGSSRAAPALCSASGGGSRSTGCARATWPLRDVEKPAHRLRKRYTPPEATTMAAVTSTQAATRRMLNVVSPCIFLRF